MAEKFVKFRKVNPPYVYTLCLTAQDRMDFIGTQVYMIKGDKVDALIEKLKRDTVLEIIDCYDVSVLDNRPKPIPQPVEDKPKKKRGER